MFPPSRDPDPDSRPQKVSWSLALEPPLTTDKLLQHNQPTLTRLQPLLKLSSERISMMIPSNRRTASSKFHLSGVLVRATANSGSQSRTLSTASRRPKAVVAPVTQHIANRITPRTPSSITSYRRYASESQNRKLNSYFTHKACWCTLPMLRC